MQFFLKRKVFFWTVTTSSPWFWAGHDMNLLIRSTKMDDEIFWDDFLTDNHKRTIKNDETNNVVTHGGGVRRGPELLQGRWLWSSGWRTSPGCWSAAWWWWWWCRWWWWCWWCSLMVIVSYLPVATRRSTPSSLFRSSRKGSARE